MGSEWGAINETRRILLEDVYFDAARYGGYGGVDDLTSQFGRWGFWMMTAREIKVVRSSS
jgi:hypothetical protein